MDDTIIATIALAISLGLATWEVVKYLLEGGRVRIRMFPGLLSDHALQRSSRSWRALAARASEHGGWTLEVAVVEIENPSRHAVTISEVALDFGRTSRFRLGRHIRTPTPLKAPGSTTDLSVRLEPLDRVELVFDVWQILSGQGVRRPLRLRASVRVAGRRRRRRSPWRRGWQVEPGQISFQGPEVEIGTAAYQTLTRHLRGREDLLPTSIVLVALEIRKRFPKSGSPPTESQLVELLEPHLLDDDPVATANVRLAAHYCAPELARHYPAEQGSSPASQ